MFALTGACLLSPPPPGDSMVRAGCWGNPGCPEPLGSGDGGNALLSCGQGHELYAVCPQTQVNSTLYMIPAKVQEQSQDIVTSKQGFVPHVLNSPSPRAPFSSHLCLQTSPAVTPLPAALAVPKSPCAVMLMPSLAKTTILPSFLSPCCPRLTCPG